MKSFVFYLCSLIAEPLIVLIGTASEATRAGRRFEVERRIRGWIYGLVFGRAGVKLDSNLELDGLANIRLGDRVSLRRSVEIVAGSRGVVTIGDGSHVGRKSIVNGSGGGVSIGCDCAISSHVSIFSVSVIVIGEPALVSPITIGDRVLIGMGVSIMPGVTIGDDARIGAGSVVVKDVGVGETVVGVPARRLADSKVSKAGTIESGVR